MSRSRVALWTRRSPALAGLGDVERLAPDGVGEFRQGAAVVDLGLGPLGLELVEDPHQLGDLLLVQVELVGEEAERPPDAESATALERPVVMRHEPPYRLTTTVMSDVLMELVVLRSLGIVDEMRRLVPALSRHAA